MTPLRMTAWEARMFFNHWGLTAEYPTTYLHVNSVYCYLARSIKNADARRQWWLEVAGYHLVLILLSKLGIAFECWHLFFCPGHLTYHTMLCLFCINRQIQQN